MQTHTAQKLRRISELKGEKIYISYETKIFHVQSISHYLIFFFNMEKLKRYNNIPQIISIQDSAFSAATLTCSTYDLHDSTGTVDRYDSKYKHLFIDVLQIKDKRDYQDSKTLFLNLAVKTVPAPLYCIDWFMQRVFLGGHFSSPLQVPFLCLM